MSALIAMKDNEDTLTWYNVGIAAQFLIVLNRKSYTLPLSQAPIRAIAYNFLCSMRLTAYIDGEESVEALCGQL